MHMEKDTSFTHLFMKISYCYTKDAHLFPYEFMEKY